jgi:hypothetical protein
MHNYSIPNLQALRYPQFQQQGTLAPSLTSLFGLVPHPIAIADPLPLPSTDMANPMEVLHVMTPAEWGKPIDVDEKWIHFVDENVKASKFGTSKSDE